MCAFGHRLVNFKIISAATGRLNKKSTEVNNLFNMVDDFRGF